MLYFSWILTSKFQCSWCQPSSSYSPKFFPLCVVSCHFLITQCTETKEVWEAYNEDAEGADCLFATKHGRWKGLHDPQGEHWYGLCSSSRSQGVPGLPQLRASGEKKGLRLDNINFRSFSLKKTSWKTKALEMLRLFFSGSFVFLDLRSCVKLHWELYAAELIEVWTKLFIGIFVCHQRQIEGWFYIEDVFTYPSHILLVPSSPSQALTALCLPQWKLLWRGMKWRWQRAPRAPRTCCAFLFQPGAEQSWAPLNWPFS